MCHFDDSVLHSGTLFFYYSHVIILVLDEAVGETAQGDVVIIKETAFYRPYLPT
jgi:hypothetical protein